MANYNELYDEAVYEARMVGNFQRYEQKKQEKKRKKKQRKNQWKKKNPFL